MGDLKITNTKYWHSITTYEIRNMDKTTELYDSYEVTLLRGG